MTEPFFPNVTFGWSFFLVLMGFLAAASYTDYRTLVIPKKISVTCFVLGILFNLARGAYLGSEGMGVWIWKDPGTALGAFDGFLFAMAGFGESFAVFMVMFVLGLCKGGDVKLFAAIGAWVGHPYVLWLMLGASIFLIFLSTVWLFANTLFFGVGHASKVYSQAQARKSMNSVRKPKNRLNSYSFPAALATLVIMGWTWRVELNILPSTARNHPVSAPTPQP